MAGGGINEYIQKGIRCAEQATAEDKADNYDGALQNYMTAAESLMHAMKYGAMNDSMKQNIREKVNRYIRRAEEIKNISKDRSHKKKPVAEGGNSKDNKYDDDNGDPDRKRMIQKFERAIVTDPNVSFDDVVGLDRAKEFLKEAAILPLKFPQLFQGKRKPWAGILLYGPPGTGKSYLAKAIATECKSTFISVSSSDLLPKWLGESETGVRCLFEVARERQPCIVFVDEIDALCGQRNDTESESSCRVKTEFLFQMQGVGTDNSGVLVLGATNFPWALDTAIRRQFEKRIYISLPAVNERAAMFKTHLGTNTYHTIRENEWMQLAQKSEHYSGADITAVCREALLRPIRRLGGATHFKRIRNPKRDGPRELWVVCSPGDSYAEELTLDRIKSDELCEPPVTISDMMAALATQRPTVGEKDLLLQRRFTEEFGQEDGTGSMNYQGNYQVPTTWEKSNGKKIRFQLSNTSDEYKLILTKFDQAMKEKYKEIIRIERIQNERWYIQYLAHSHNFKTRLNSNTEKRLYHGCPEDAVNSILDDCFNRSFAGVNGTLYGVGVYFSSNAAYSHGYAKPNANGERNMFVARVLVGSTTEGNHSMKTRPSGFDSTTDGDHIFVTYHDAQAYAEYLITYK